MFSGGSLMLLVIAACHSAQMLVFVKRPWVLAMLSQPEESVQEELCLPGLKTLPSLHFVRQAPTPLDHNPNDPKDFGDPGNSQARRSA
jgi:hypothetical protein